MCERMLCECERERARRCVCETSNVRERATER